MTDTELKMTEARHGDPRKNGREGIEDDRNGEARRNEDGEQRET